MSSSQKNKSSMLRMVTQLSKPYRREAILMIIAGFVCSACDSIFPLFNKYALDHYIADKTLDTLAVFILLYIAVLLIQFAGSFISAAICGKIEVSVNRDLRNASFRHLQSLSLSYFNRHSVGSIHSRVMSDTSKIGDTVSWQLMSLVWAGSYLISMLISMLVISPQLFLIVLVLMLAALLISVFFERKLIRVNRIIREQNAVLTGDMNEMITGIRAVKSNAIEEKLERSFRADTEKMRQHSFHAGHLSALFFSLIGLTSSAVLAAVLHRGGQLTAAGMLRIGTLSVFMSYALGMMEPIHNIVQTAANFIAIRASWERYTALMNTTADVTDSDAVIAKYGDAFSPKRENWEPVTGDIEFENVSFTYPDGSTEVLTDFSLTVPHGSTVAIVGETGAGKSTLVNLVCRFYEPTKGRVLLDGRDIRERSVAWLHSHIGYVLQTPHLFSGTVRDNLRYGSPDATDSEITAALHAVSAEEIVQSLSDGLDSPVGEGGNALSTGQKQLLSFARAILADPDILILDEATASVDTLTEKRIQNAIKALTAGRTSFVIAHRLSTIVHADLIIAVHDGRIAEQGTHRELMAKKGYYYSLYTRHREDIDRVLEG